MKLDAIRAVEACYAKAADDSGWLDGLLESLSSPGEPRVLAQIWGFGKDGNRTVECEASSGSASATNRSRLAPSGA